MSSTSDDFAGNAGPREYVLDPNAKSFAPSIAQDRGPVHVLHAGRYYAEVVGGIPMIFRADTAGAVTHIESPVSVQYEEE